MWAPHVSSFFNIQPRTVRPTGEELGGGAGYNGEEFGEGRGRGAGGGEAGRRTDPLFLVFLRGQVGGRSSEDGSALAERSSGKDRRGREGWRGGAQESGEERVRQAERRGGRPWRAARPLKIRAEWPATVPACEAQLTRGGARPRLRPRARTGSLAPAARHRWRRMMLSERG
jgi:hypothetical protein